VFTCIRKQDQIHRWILIVVIFKNFVQDCLHFVKWLNLSLDPIVCIFVHEITLEYALFVKDRPDVNADATLDRHFDQSVESVQVIFGELSVAEHSVHFMHPDAHERSRIDQNKFLCIADALEYFGNIAQIEQLVRFGWNRQ